MIESATSLTVAPGPPRRRGCWLLLSGLAILLLLLAAGASFALYLFADREQIRAELEGQLGRPVKLEGLAIGFFAINLHGLEVADTAGFNPDPLLKLGAASITPDWSNLLSGKVIISGITLRGAALNLEFDTAGRSNITGLMRPATGESKLSLDKLVFDSCAVSLRWPEHRLVFTALSGNVSHLSAAPYELDLAAALAGGTLRLTGNAAPGLTNLHVVASALPAALLNLRRGTLPEAAALNATLDFAFSDTRAVLKGGGSVTALLRGFTCDLALPWPLPAADSRAVMPPVTGSLTATAAVAELRALPLLASALNAIDGQGSVKAGIDFSGSGRFALSDLAFRFDNCSLAVPALKDRLEGLNGPFRVNETALTITDASFSISGLPFRGSGSIGFSPFTLDLAINGEKLDLARAAQLTKEPVLPAGMTISGNGNAALTVRRTGDATDVSGGITLLGSQLVLAAPPLTLTGMTGSVGFDDAGLVFRGIAAQTCGGSVRLNGTVGAGSRLPFALALDGSGLGLAPLLNALVGPHAQGGLLDCSLQLAGDSTLTATYNGAGWLKLDRPQFTEAAFFTKLAPYLGISDATLLSRYDTGSAAFTLAGGHMNFARPMRLQNRAVDLAAAGTIDLAGPMALRGQVSVPSRSLAGAIAGIQLAQLGGVHNDGERTLIGFTVAGTLQQPSFGLDANPANLLSLPAAIVSAPSQAVGALLGAVLGPRTDTAGQSGATGETTANPAQQLRDRFRDIFRR